MDENTEAGAAGADLVATEASDTLGVAELAALAVADAADGERRELVVDGQCHVVWRDAAGVHVENRGSC